MSADRFPASPPARSAVSAAPPSTAAAAIARRDASVLAASASALPLPRFRPFALLLRAELDALYAVQRVRRALPLALRWLFDRLISAHPLYDVSVALWMAAPFALWARGWVLFWLLVLNVFAAFALHWTLGAPSPGALDARLRPRGRVSPSGFPCMELQVASALLGYLAWWHATPAAVLGAGAAGAALLATRVYALTHFPHQLALSVALGGFSVPAGRAVARYFFKTRLHPQVHALGAVAVVFLVVGFVAYHVESNAVPFMRIPRSECARRATRDGPAAPPFSRRAARTLTRLPDAPLPPYRPSPRRRPRARRHHRQRGARVRRRPAAAARGQRRARRRARRRPPRVPARGAARRARGADERGAALWRL
jgi:hypothetical protein